MDDGRKVTVPLYKELKSEEIQKIRQQVGEENYESGKFEEAVELFDELTLSDAFADFLTLPGYRYL
jgi:malate synthase